MLKPIEAGIKAGTEFETINKFFGNLPLNHRVVIFSQDHGSYIAFGDSGYGSGKLDKELLLKFFKAIDQYGSMNGFRSCVVIIGKYEVAGESQYGKMAGWIELPPTNFGLEWKAPESRVKCSCCGAIRYDMVTVCPGCQAVML